jgi:peptidoglycan hydrolase FlgJ
LAINPPSDIVLDVLNAADPTKAEAATQRLNALGSGVRATDDFTKVLDTAASSASVGGLADARNRLMNKALADTQKTARAKVDFEASLLSNLVGEMLPKDMDSVYGQGTAGDIWRSMMGDQIAHQIAKSGRLGIADRLFATHALPHDGGKSHASLLSRGGAVDAAQSSGNPLSLPTGADDANGAFLFGDHKKS